jgi:hypothetical protein
MRRVSIILVITRNISYYTNIYIYIACNGAFWQSYKYVNFQYTSGLLGFWTLSIVLYSKQRKRQSFWNTDLFPSSDEGVGDTYSLWSVKKDLTLVTGRWTKSKNLVISCVIHYRQNPLQPP